MDRFTTNFNSDDNNTSNVQNLSAMLVALANSPSNISNLNNASIPSPQSAFSLLTRRAAAAMNMVSNTGEFSSDTTSSPSTSTSLMNINLTNNNGISLNNNNNQLPNHSMFLSQSSSKVPQLDSSTFSPNSTYNADAAAAAFEKFSKIFENAGTSGLNEFNCSMLAKIQQHFGLDIPASSSSDRNNFSLFSNSQLSNKLISEQGLQNLPQNFSQQQGSVFSNAPSTSTLLKTVPIQRNLNDNNNFQQQQEQDQQHFGNLKYI